MNELIPLSNFRKISAARANAEDCDDAIKDVTRLFVELCGALDLAIHNTATPVLGIAANVSENSSIGSMRTDDIKWRFAELKNELFAGLADLRGDIVGRIRNADDYQQLWGE